MWLGKLDWLWQLPCGSPVSVHSTARVSLTEGIHFRVVIASQAYTFTAAHIEYIKYMLLESVDDLLISAHKVWAVTQIQQI